MQTGERGRRVKGKGRKKTREEGCRLVKDGEERRKKRERNKKEGCRLEKEGELGRMREKGEREQEKKDANWRRREK